MVFTYLRVWIQILPLNLSTSQSHLKILHNFGLPTSSFTKSRCLRVVLMNSWSFGYSLCSSMETLVLLKTTMQCIKLLTVSSRVMHPGSALLLRQIQTSHWIHWTGSRISTRFSTMTQIPLLAICLQTLTFLMNSMQLRILKWAGMVSEDGMTSWLEILLGGMLYVFHW